MLRRSAPPELANRVRFERGTRNRSGSPGFGAGCGAGAGGTAGAGAPGTIGVGPGTPVGRPAPVPSGSHEGMRGSAGIHVKNSHSRRNYLY